MTSYQKERNLEYQAEDAYWVGSKYSKFVTVKILKTSDASYIIATIEKIMLNDDQSNLNQNQSFLDRHFSGPFESGSDFWKDANVEKDEFNSGSSEEFSNWTKYRVELKLWGIEKTTEFKNKLFPINVFDLSEEKLGINTRDVDQMTIHNLNYDQIYGKGIFFVKDSANHLFFFESFVDSLTFKISKKKIHLKEIVIDAVVNHPYDCYVNKDRSYIEKKLLDEKLEILKIKSDCDYLFVTIN